MIWWRAVARNIHSNLICLLDLPFFKISHRRIFGRRSACFYKKKSSIQQLQSLAWRLDSRPPRRLTSVLDFTANRNQDKSCNPGDHRSKLCNTILSLFTAFQRGNVVMDTAKARGRDAPLAPKEEHFFNIHEDELFPQLGLSNSKWETSFETSGRGRSISGSMPQRF